MRFKQYIAEVKLSDVEKLPDFIPLPEVQRILKKYKVNPIWKEWVSKKMQHSHQIGYDHIVINPKHKNDLKVQLHELGHYLFTQGFVDREAVKRLFQFYKKTAEKWGKAEGVKSHGFRVIDGEAMYFKNIDEFFSDMFSAYSRNKLKGDNKKVMQMLMTGKRY
jgi:hypothetical protein